MEAFALLKRVLNHWLLLLLRLVILIFMIVYRKLHQFIMKRTDLDDVVDLIINGEFAVPNPFYEITYRIVEDVGVKAGILESKTHLDRVNILENAFPTDEFNELCQILTSGPSGKALGKNIEMSGLFAKRGDSAYKVKDFVKALRCYNLARCFAPSSDHGAIADLHEKRSHVLMALNDTKAASVDIQLAKYYRDTDPAFGHSHQLPPVLPTLQDVNGDDWETQQMRQYRNNTLFQVQVEGDTHKYFPAANECLELVQNETKGKHFITTMNLEPGTPVIVEKQYAHVLNNGLKWCFGHCFKCLEKTQTPIPCDGCVFATYCSFKCRSEDENSHQYECGCMAYMHSLKLSRDIHLCVKAICKAGPVLLEGLMDKHRHVENFRDEIMCEKNYDHGHCQYDPYCHLLRLTSHTHTELPLFTWLAVCVVNVLDKNTKFFPGIKEQIRNPVNLRQELKSFIASALLHHLVCFPYNTTSINERNDTRLVKNSSKLMKNPQQDDIPIAIGVYPTVNFLNHSCQPNTIRLQMVNGTTAIVTNCLLKKGEEILHTYGFEFLGDEKDSRQRILLQHFKFLCDCIPCTLDWPTYKDLSREVRFFCPYCSIKDRKSLQTLIQKCVLTSTERKDFGICKLCLTEFQLNTLRRKTVENERRIKIAKELIESEKPILAIPYLIEAINFFHRNVYPPSIPLIVAKLALSQAFCIITAVPGGY